jgi:KUP system potassium uptake protein
MAVIHAGMPKRPGIFQATATLGALGVVYGDIGTSPLYAPREAARAAAHGGTVTPDAVLGYLTSQSTVVPVDSEPPIISN